MPLSHETIMETLRTIPDPEMPISIVDLGIVEEVRTLAHDVVISILPTFVGCPALDMIAGEIRQKVGALPGVDSVEVCFIHEPPWSVDRISSAGRESLRAHGVSVPSAGSPPVRGRENACCGGGALVPLGGLATLPASAVPCPFCGSSDTRLESAFGPTRCRSIYYCDGCRNSFEHMKRV